MSEISPIGSTNNKIQADTNGSNTLSTSTDQTHQESVFVPTEKLIENVAKYIARNPDGSLDTKTAKELSNLDLLGHITATLDIDSIADTPEDKEYIEGEYKAFSALLLRREEEEEMLKDYSKDLFDTKNQK